MGNYGNCFLIMIKQKFNANIWKPSEYTSQKDFINLQKRESHIRGSEANLEIKKIFSKALKTNQIANKDIIDHQISKISLSSGKINDNQEQKLNIQRNSNRMNDQGANI